MDIISQNPVWHSETIKKYPKYTLEDKDAYYYRRMAPKDPHQAPSPEKATGNRYQSESKKDSMHGRQVYHDYKGKMELDLWDSYQGQKPIAPKFRAGMLNHADDFRCIM